MITLSAMITLGVVHATLIEGYGHIIIVKMFKMISMVVKTVELTIKFLKII